MCADGSSKCTPHGRPPGGSANIGTGPKTLMAWEILSSFQPILKATELGEILLLLFKHASLDAELWLVGQRQLQSLSLNLLGHFHCWFHPCSRSTLRHCRYPGSVHPPCRAKVKMNADTKEKMHFPSCIYHSACVLDVFHRLRVLNGDAQDASGSKGSKRSRRGRHF